MDKRIVLERLIEENNGLPKVESFENLYKIMQDKELENYYNESIDIGMAESATDIKGDMTITQSANKVENSEKEESDYSNTNAQVEGVDEADIVKTDGNYIYYVTNDKVIIVNAQDEKNLKIVSEIQYNDNNFNPRELFIEENKLIVIGNLYENYSKSNVLSDVAYPRNNQRTVKRVF